MDDNRLICLITGSMIERWFASRGWTPFPFQRQVWDSFLRGESGLIHAATGTGKTYAALFGPLVEEIRERGPGGLRLLWVTPLRALASDTVQALEPPIRELAPDWRVELRTGDTSSSLKARQRKKLPQILVTTPESLALLMTYPEWQGTMAGLGSVVVDEWHELLGTKRGVLVELALARLRGCSSSLRTWGLSATVGDLGSALEALTGAGRPGRIVLGEEPRPLLVEALAPARMERFPWAGHLGLRLLPQVAEALEGCRTALLFTNTRSQAELWHQALLETRPEWADRIGLHHGSLDREERERVEAGLRAGVMRCVVCTSSLDLGVDFPAVDRVFQVGSPRGVARLLQRAGRSGHGPGLASRVTCIPASALELVEIAAARRAAEAGDLESRPEAGKPMDVLVQHLVSAALGGGFDPGELLLEVRSTRAYRYLSDAEWSWAMDFTANGGQSLWAYPEHRRLALEEGRYTVADPQIARRHRMSVGTIVSELSVTVALVGGGRLGSVEESFAARLSPGDRFAFAGKSLELIQLRDMTAWVRPAPSSGGLVPRWHGGRLPMSPRLAAALRVRLDEAARGIFDSPEMEAVRPVLEAQAAWSVIPAADELLVERLASREGHHLFLYPFEGRLVHEGLTAVLAVRLARLRPVTLTMACNDYGLELLSAAPLPFEAPLLSPEGIEADLAEGLNATEMARRAFREVARVAGLVFQGYPGRSKTARQLTASSGLYFDVFRRWDPDNLLLLQARREAAVRGLESGRLAEALARLRTVKYRLVDIPRPTPLAFPLMVEHLRDRLSTERLADRIRSMQLTCERAADKAGRRDVSQEGSRTQSLTQSRTQSRKKHQGKTG